MTTVTNTIKLNLANFDYYLLKISPAADLAQIESKLASLRQFDPNSKFLVIECESKPELSDFTKKIQSLDQLCIKLGFELKFILANEFIVTNFIHDKPVIELPVTIKSKPIINQTLLVEEPVRSGMQINNDGDIIINNLVSHNAEIIASGNIHIYGDCRGRVVAGSSGNKKAKIFVTRFNAELISIAGVYRVIEDKLPANLHHKAVHIFLDDKDRLNIMPL